MANSKRNEGAGVDDGARPSFFAPDFLCGVGEHLLRMLPGIHLRVNLRNLALLIDEVTDAIGVAGFHIRARAICEAELAVGVA